MNKISTRFALLMSAAAVVPLLAYGAVSIMSVRDGAQQAVIQGNQDVARRVAEQLEQYVTGYIRILNALAADLQRTELAQWQQTLILNNFVGQFNEFQQLALVNENGQTVASSGVARQDAELPGPDSFPIENARISRFSIDDDSLPSAVAAIALPRTTTAGGWLVGVLQLEQLWRTVDGIRVGNTGYALVVTDDDYILAHGHKNMKPLVARREKLRGNPVLAAIRTSPSSNGAAVARQYESGGEQVLGVAAALQAVGWTVIVEQPTREAFAISTRLQTQLFVAITVALFAMLLVGSLWGRRFIEPILVLTRGTHELARGKLDTRVAVETSDELGQLGTAFNTMADKLVELQEDVRKKERHAMFGRIAIGLVHDLSHPIQNVGNGCKLILKMWDDPEYRESFRRTIERELAQIKRVLDDLRNVAKPMPVERFPIDVNKSVGDLVDSMLTTAENAGIAMNCDLVREPLFVEGDLFALNRIYRNLIINAVQATPPRGRVLVRTLKQNGHAVIEVADTGCGIPAERLESIFDDFVTTKRRGLGLGLAISKKVVEQLGGTIAVTSQVGVGSTFTVQFPLTSARPSKIAAV
ncbi:MAG: ATP-binding protein [Vicinamibacterales bacterium]